MADTLDITIVMPCLNEAETLAVCIQKAQSGIARAGVTGEVLIADNGSTDGSIQIAESLGARVEHVREKGYGNALRGGIQAARGRWILMGDSDDSYDFSNIGGFITKLREGSELVMGCRLPSGGGTIVPGAMPWKNRWIGNPILSSIGRLFFRTPIHDFHCGMRGFSADAYRKMDLKTTGMEFASEMVMKATLKGLRVAEVPITLHPDGRSRPPHLKPWRDGWRHLRFMLIYSPKWLFLMPGVVLFVLGLLGISATLRSISCGFITTGFARRRSNSIY
jgi:glycosyltransferase involved in cell wall biosynthesis